MHYAVVQVKDDYKMYTPTFCCFAVTPTKRICKIGKTIWSQKGENTLYHFQAHFACHVFAIYVILKGKIDAILCLICGLEWHTKNGIHAVLQSCLRMTCGMPVLTEGSVSGLVTVLYVMGFFISVHTKVKNMNQKITFWDNFTNCTLPTWWMSLRDTSLVS